MEAIRLTLNDVIQMTLDVGEDWAAAPAKRLLQLIEQIGADLSYDIRIVELAAYIHD